MEEQIWKKIIIFASLGIALALGLALGGHKLIQTFGPKIPLLTPTPIPTLTASPTPILSAPQSPEKAQIQIINGNVCLRKDTDQIEILVDKESFAAISRFSDLSFSPDQKKICFLGQTAAPIWLFWANTDGSEVTQVAPAKNCVWSPDSQKIAYNNHVTDVSPVDVYVYYLTTNETKNLTQKTAEEGITRFYETPRWSMDGQKILARFTTIELPDERTKKTGLSEINLVTGEIKDQLLEEGLVDF